MFNQLDQPTTYYQFQPLKLFAVVNLLTIRGQLMGHHVCTDTLLLLLLRNFFNVASGILQVYIHWARLALVPGTSYDLLM
jgi:hypothetical protein